MTSTICALVLLSAFQAPPETKESLAKKLTSKNAAERQSAATKLAAMGAKEYAKQIQSLLTDDTATVVLAAIDALVKLEAADCASAIADQLTHKAEIVRAGARKALDSLNAKSCAAKAGAAISKMATTQEKRELVALLVKWKAKAEGVKIAAVADELGATAVEAVIVLDARDAAPQLAAILVKERPTDANEAYAAMFTKKKILEALTSWKAMAQSAAVAKVLKPGFEELWARAADALRVMGAKEHAAAVAALIESISATYAGSNTPSDSPLPALVRCLGAIGDSSHAKLVVPLLNAKDTLVGQEAVWALATWKCTDQAAAVAAFVAATPDHRARAIAIHALVLLGAKDQSKVIVEALASGEPVVRVVAVLALGDLGATADTDGLSKLLAGDHVEVHLAVVAALSLAKLHATDEATLAALQKKVLADATSANKAMDWTNSSYDLDRTGLAALHKRTPAGVIADAIETLKKKP